MRGPSPAAIVLVHMANSCGRSLFSSRLHPWAGSNVAQVMGFPSRFDAGVATLK